MNKKNRDAIKLAIAQTRAINGVFDEAKTALDRVVSTLSGIDVSSRELKVLPPAREPKKREPEMREGVVAVAVGGMLLRFSPQLPGSLVPRIFPKSLAAVATLSENDLYEVVIANAFPNVGDLEIQRGSITWPDGHQTTIPAMTLTPGMGVTFSSSDRFSGVKGTNSLKVNNLILDAHSARGQFHLVQGRKIFGNRDANEGSGMLIYPGVRYWAEQSPRLASEIMRGYLHRCPVFRWDREQFAKGRIVQAKLQDSRMPVDRTAGFAPIGYGANDWRDPVPLPRLDGYNALDGQHLGRIGHVAAELARQGNALGKLVLSMLADHVADSWCRETAQGSNQLLGIAPQNLMYWGCYDIIIYWPEGTPCPLLGREYGHAAAIMANAVKYCGRSDDDLALMIATMEHCMDWDLGSPYALTKFLPLNFEIKVKQDAWIHKIQEFGGKIPDDEKPMVLKTFELGPLFFASVAVEGAGVSASLESQARNLRVRLRKTINENRAQLWVPGHEGWNSEATVDWVDELLSRTPTELAVKDKETKSPIGSDNSAPCYLGEW